HVLDDLEGLVDCVIDGGASDYGIESTVVHCSDCHTRILRHGAITREMITAELGITIADDSGGVDDAGGRPRAPGQEASHYAPLTPVCPNCRSGGKTALWLGFGPEDYGADLNLSDQGDLDEAARNLFGMLRESDRQAIEADLERICVSPIPVTGIGVAINDRLRRAASRD
ncbi:MAG: translation factor Sua5, partial [Rhodobacteraceae bacterium]|nr:translation factor Sua5 [Paracoccaceae bacterium]